MKIYFTADGHKIVADFADESNVPEHVAVFTFAANQSTFTPRYSLVDGVLKDNYVGKTDEEVAAAIKAADDAEAARLAALHAPKS
jgi:hypothetical protein